MVIFCSSNIFAQKIPWWWTYPNKLPIGNNFDYVPCMGEGKTETEARRKAEAESYRMFTAKNKYVEFSEITYKEIEENGLRATLPEYATNYTFVCNPKPEKTGDNHYKVYILYAWRRDLNKSVNFGEVDTKVCDEKDEQLDYVELQDDAGIMVQKAAISSSTLKYEDAVLLCKNSLLGGFSDWRIPTIEELSMIFSNKKILNAIKINKFHYGAGVYWSLYWSSDKARHKGYHSSGYKQMDLNDGTIRNPFDVAGCLCVRGEQRYKEQYVDIQEAGIAVQTDDISYEEIYWENAKILCANSIVGGYTDWRMPTINELSTIFSNQNKIANFENSNYWSDKKKGSIIDMKNGAIHENDYSGKTNYCRCVRSLP
jgi:hypothetical protein